MSSVASWSTSLSARISEHIDEAVVVAGSNQALLLVHVDAINVGAVRAFWEDAVDAPAELAVLRLPNGAGGVRCARGILAAGWNHEEEELIAVTNRPNIRAILAPIDASDRSIVLLALSYESVTIINIVNVNIGVMRACC